MCTEDFQRASGKPPVASAEAKPLRQSPNSRKEPRKQRTSTSKSPSRGTRAASFPPPRQQRLIIHLLRQLILIELEHIRHLADGDVRAIVEVVHNVLHPADLEAVDDEVHNRHFLVRKTALRRDARHACAERLAQPELLDSVTNYECYKGLYSSFNTHNMHEIGYSLNRQFGPEEWTLYKGLPLYNFVDNHDVERIASQLEDKEHLPLIYAMEFAMPGVPGVYYGSEWGMEGKKEQGSDDSLRPRIHKEDLVENELTNYIAQLAKVRAGSPALKYGDYLQLAIAPDVLVFQRRTNEDRIIFAMNCGDGEFTAHFDAQAGCGIDLITGDSVDFGGGLTIQGKTAMIIRTEEVSLP